MTSCAWLKRSKFSCGRTVLHIVVVVKSLNWLNEGSSWNSVIWRVVQEQKIQPLPAHDVTVIFPATFKMCHEHFYNLKLPYFGYLSQILWFWMYLFFCCQCPLIERWVTAPSPHSRNLFTFLCWCSLFSRVSEIWNMRSYVTTVWFSRENSHAIFYNQQNGSFLVKRVMLCKVNLSM